MVSIHKGLGHDTVWPFFVTGVVVTNYSHFVCYHHMKKTTSGISPKHGFSDWTWVNGDGESLLPWILFSCGKLEDGKYVSVLSLVLTVLPWTHVSATTSDPGQEWWQQPGKVVPVGRACLSELLRLFPDWRGHRKAIITTRGQILQPFCSFQS